MTYVLAVDPGTTKSAWMVINEDTLEPVAWRWEDNLKVMGRIARWDWDENTDIVIEDVQLMGMPAGRDVFETVKWAGRFDYRSTATWIPRPTVKGHICGSVRATDANIRQAIIDRYGGQEKAIGGVKCPKCKGRGWAGRGRPPCPVCADFNKGWAIKPGILHDFSKSGMGSHGWSALALALTYIGTAQETRE